VHKTGRLLLLSGIVLCLLQVLLPQYFLTGDGPGHVYNAQMLHDLWSNKNVSFYESFYSLNRSPNPNWLTHILLALLMFIVNGALAEKILLSLYIILFVTGFYTLLKKLNNNVSIWPVVALLFVFHHPLIKGFYNFSFSIGFLFWLVIAWLSYLDKKKAGSLVSFFLLIALTFFSHPMSFIYGGVICFGLLLTYIFSGTLTGSSAIRFRPFSKYFSILLLCFLPFLILLKIYTDKNTTPIDLHFFSERIGDALQFTYLPNRMETERIIAPGVGILLVGTFIITLFIRFRKGYKIHKYDGLILSLLFAIGIYLFFPDFMLGGGLLVMRAQLFVFILFACCIAYAPLPKTIFTINTSILLLLFLCLSFIRIPSIMASSRGEEDYMSAAKYIAPNSVILPLSFANNGKDEHGNAIASANWIFEHAGDYLGIYKPLIILDNYEANTGYFPLCWKGVVNPYHSLNSLEGIEGNPPYVAIQDYTNASHIQINYIITWCYDTTMLKQGHVAELMQQISSSYHAIYTSPSGRTVLYERNK